MSAANWWIIATIFFQTPFWAGLGPAVFIIINYFSMRFELIKSLGGNDKQNYGTIIFPISLLILTLLCFSSFAEPYLGALGIFCLGYGDSAAALFGRKYGKKKIGLLKNGKTYFGTSAMFTVSFIVCCLILFFHDRNWFVLKSVVLSLVSATVESISPKGFDNITVPISVFFVYYICFY